MPLTEQQESRVLRQTRRVMVVGAEAGQARQALSALAQAGYQCEAFAEGETALEAVGRLGADAMVVDVGIAGPSALELLRLVRKQSPQTVVVILASSPAVATAVAAIREGAFGYLIKPVNPEELAVMVAKALEVKALKRENRLLRDQIEVARMAAAFVAESPESRRLVEIIRRAAPTHSPVLIEGESGTGKELIARMLHHWSARARGAFVRVSFKSFLSSAGLGFSGQGPQAGVAALLGEYASRAHSGTLFLDEVGEASAQVQASLLSLVGDTRAGASAAVQGPFDVRVVATTNHALAREITAGHFRADLYFALAVIPIQVAPLRKRLADILPLARHFLALHAAESGRVLTLSSEAQEALLSYSWPGNVRELENVIERAVVMTSGERIVREVLGLDATGEVSQPTQIPASGLAERPDTPHEAARAADAKSATAQDEPGGSTFPGPNEFAGGTLADCLDRAARARVKAALEAAKGEREAAAAALGIDRATLTRLIKRLGI